MIKIAGSRAHEQHAAQNGATAGTGGVGLAGAARWRALVLVGAPARHGLARPHRAVRCALLGSLFYHPSVTPTGRVCLEGGNSGQGQEFAVALFNSFI